MQSIYFVLFLMLAVLCNTKEFANSAIANEPQTLKKIRKAGGKVSFEGKDRQIRIDLSGIALMDSHIRALATLRNLTVLNLSRTRLTNRRLFMLRDLKSLRRLDLSSNPITSQGLKYISGMRKLRD